jgi:hypothetical protein
MSKTSRKWWAAIGIGGTMACIVALIQGNGSISPINVCILGILGTLFLFGAAIGLKWHKAPFPIGTAIRTFLLFVFCAGLMGAVCWHVWPESPRAANQQPHEQTQQQTKAQPPVPSPTPPQTPPSVSPSTKRTHKPTGIENCNLLVKRLLKRYQSQNVESDLVAWVNEESIKQGSDCRIRRHTSQGVAPPVSAEPPVLVEVIGGKNIDVGHVEGGKVIMTGVENGTVSHIGDKTTATPTPPPLVMRPK